MGFLCKMIVALPVAALMAGGSTSIAQTSAWGRMAADDLAAARALISDTHPGASAGADDRRFLGQLERGYASASALAVQARTYGDYRAALQRFAASFDDPHIRSEALVEVPEFWPGFRVGLRNDGWVVTARAVEAAPEPGSLLESCDRRTPEQLADARLAPFFANWRVRATKMRASRDLLIDRGNPQQPRLKECTFKLSSGQTRTLQLKWEPVPSQQPAQPGSPAPRADVGLTEFAGGWWLRLGTSGSRAVPLLEQARLRRDSLKSAPFVVLDLRGNDGGASYFTDALAEIIYGEDRVAQARRPKGTGEEQIVWRSSPGALQTLEAYVPRVTRMASPDHPAVLGMIAQREEVRRALEAGQPLARAPALVRTGNWSEAARPPATPARVILLTDRWCFSSCLMGAWLFRKLGATHVGDETDANTRYSNLRTVDLPSGLSNFSTLQSYSTYSPMQFGPYVPSIRFTGDLNDDAAVREWVRTTVLERRR